jgi:hypothetical protein
MVASLVVVVVVVVVAVVVVVVVAVAVARVHLDRPSRRRKITAVTSGG